MASRRETGFYSALNITSSVDLLPKNRQSRMRGSGRLWPVDRLIEKRRSQDKKHDEYLVSWRDYSPYQASWEPEHNITEDCIRIFLYPQPEKDLIVQETTKLRIGVEQHLASRSRLPITLFFRGDIYRYLFKGKGYHQSGWHFLAKADFPTLYFPDGWDCLADAHGQGIKVFYPVKMRQFTSFSPKKYVLSSYGSFVIAPRAFQEKLSISFVKVALGDS